MKRSKFKKVYKSCTSLTEFEMSVNIEMSDSVVNFFFSS